jgi:hypothetical protein
MDEEKGHKHRCRKKANCTALMCPQYTLLDCDHSFCRDYLVTYLDKIL